MAIRHYAYGFVPETYLAGLLKAGTAGGKFSPESLRSYAETVVRGANAQQQAILKNLRFEEDEWLRSLEDDPTLVEWLEIALVPHLRQLPSLSHREAHSYFVLRRILPTMGWSQADVDALILGESLASLPIKSSNSALVPWFSQTGWHCGWMDRETVRRRADALADTAAGFTGMGTEQRSALADWTAKSPVEQDGAIRDAFADAGEMLEKAWENGWAVVLMFE